ncbi:diguanylate cyclase/phosphodiesterase (GGDEF & EAL domains) with PAS/PAC sensor(s) [Euzebya pacifica]|uniref:Diguanylate cyclase/phosphodiesterase (GGDEF & EAL domains) with PAS/PAC sensor(S) n=1 Tax=Euzebya pacifica TaxID=1608957 RepID=A0A346XW02_9ACTN|nr:diguanylate cyclase/phosphodiesterase (GGDEF & EAL domains) with PAS/PAC sensor(s) [Euzebya pacifica]
MTDGSSASTRGSVVPALPRADMASLHDQGLVGVLWLDGEGRIEHLNDRAATLLDSTAPKLVARLLAELVRDRDAEALEQAIAAVGVEPSRTLVLHVHRAGAWAHLGMAVCRIGGTDGGVMVLLADRGPGLAQVEEAQRQTRVDALTQLQNRPLLVGLLEDRLAADDRTFAVVALNVDRLRAINDSLGHASGDAVLVTVADRLQALLRPEDAVARVAGDDFVVVCDGVSTRAHASSRVERMLAAIAQPMQVEGLDLHITASAGVMLVTNHDRPSADVVITQANDALAAAKQQGRARFLVHDDDVRTTATDRLHVETSLRRALAEQRLRVAYQPIRDMRAGRIAGAEALARWDDPELGTVTPERFMPVARDSGLVEPLTRFVLDRAVADAAAWRASSGVDVHVAVNLSAQDLSRRNLATEIATTLSGHGLPPRALRLEIVETILVEADDRVRRNLSDLRDLGISLGIDDFGTGWSSMSYLKHLPIDFVKIDKSFVMGLGTDREDTAIVRAVVGLAKSLDLTVVAEGIEHPTQMRLLTELGCDLGQGFLIGHAEPADVMAASLQASG